MHLAKDLIRWTKIKIKEEERKENYYSIINMIRAS